MVPIGSNPKYQVVLQVQGTSSIASTFTSTHIEQLHVHSHGLMQIVILAIKNLIFENPSFSQILRMALVRFHKRYLKL